MIYATLPKIVYLFGAGATHAEIRNLVDSPTELYFDKAGLLISQVSKRVIKAAQGTPRFKKNVELVTHRTGPVNIELLISLIETNKIPDSDYKIGYLKELVESDIKSILTQGRRKLFCLHKALLELHQLKQDEEELTGLISLNYDSVLDEAYETIFGNPPNYCRNTRPDRNIPLLKLHGSFSWKGLNLYGKSRDISIMPLGINKNYLAPPYNFIWGKAFELLAACSTLRVIGCSLSQNDFGLIDLLFKAHLERSSPLNIEIIDTQQQGERIQYDYGFLPKIFPMRDIEQPMIADDSIFDNSQFPNPFKIWLTAKADKMLGARVDSTRFIKKLK